MRQRVKVVVVTDSDRSSSTRRMAYRALSRSAVQTDIGWIVIDEDVLEKLERLRRRHAEETGRELYRLYDIQLSPEELYRLYDNALKEGIRDKHIEVSVRKQLRNLEKKVRT